MSESKYHVPNLERALEIFEFLAEHPEGLSAAELQEQLDISKNSIFRITTTLTDRGYLQRNEADKKLSLSAKLLGLGYAALGVERLRESALGPMEILRQSTRETVLLGRLLDTDGLVIEQLASPEPIKFLVDVGTRFPLHCSAPGKIFLAHLNAEQQQFMLARLTLTRFNERTLCEPKLLRKEFKDILTQGFSLDRAEEIDGLHCIAAPIFDFRKQLLASVWVTAPSYRLPMAKFEAVAEQVMACAKSISVTLGNMGN